MSTSLAQSVPGAAAPREIFGWRPYVIACSASWASAMFGYDSAFIGSSLSLPSFIKDFNLDGPKKTALSSNITSVFQAGAFFGAILGYYMGEYWGRRANLITSGIIFIAGVALQIACTGYGQIGMMYAGRVLTGVAVGASSLVTPIYIAESAPAAIRGRMISLFEIFLQVGSLIGFWINYGVSQNMPSNTTQWRVPFAIQLIPAGLLVITMPFMIESPRWLAKKQRYEAARKNLSWVRSLPEDHPYIQNEMAEIRAQMESEESAGQGLGELRASWNELCSKKLRFRVLFAMAMKWMSNASGYWSWKGASLDIWRDKGPSTGMEDAWGAVFNKETPSSVATTITVFYDTHPSLLPDDLLEIPDLRRYFSPDFWPAPHNRALAGMGS